MEVTFKVPGSGAKPYEVVFDAADMSGPATCTCMAWRFSAGPRAQATCKHIDQVRASVAVRVADGGYASGDAQYNEYLRAGAKGSFAQWLAASQAA